MNKEPRYGTGFLVFLKFVVHIKIINTDQMSHYRYFIIETYENKGAPSSRKVRARPLPGQGVSPSLSVECSVTMRDSYPPGTLFKVECKFTDREGTSFLYRHYNWPYEIVTQAQAKIFIEHNFAKQPLKSQRS